MIRTVPLRRTPLPRRRVPIVTRQTARRREMKALDALWRELVFLRDSKTCQAPICGKQRGVQAHHVFTKKKHGTRWDIDNGIALCRYHHIWYAHQHPIRFHEWMRKRLGADRYDRLLLRSQLSIKVDLMAVRMELQMMVVRLELQRVQGSR